MGRRPEVRLNPLLLNLGCQSPWLPSTPLSTLALLDLSLSQSLLSPPTLTSLPAVVQALAQAPGQWKWERLVLSSLPGMGGFKKTKVLQMCKFPCSNVYMLLHRM